MSHSINILPQNLANKIAAGEVIQRPASALKELIENAIDGQASTIKTLLLDSGRRLIQVIDDGIGMNPEDAQLAFQRHATSKISSYEDLEEIVTFGFRGEALASMAAVSQIEMRTRLHDADTGTRVRIEGGLLISSTEDAPPAGTSISVKNLFYNTPARRNFLKSNATEFKHLCDVVNRAAISHPGIAFELYHQEDKILDVRSAERTERIRAVFGESVSNSLFEFEHQGEGVHVSGFVGKPAFARKTRTEQYLFLNNRNIFNKTVAHAVFSAYEHLLEKGSFPFYIIFLTLDPKRFDINVHPSKMEVKFADDQFLHRTVFSAIRNALGTADLVPQVGMRNPPDDNADAFRMQFLSPTKIPANQQMAGWRDLLRGITNPPEDGHVAEEPKRAQAPLPLEGLPAAVSENVPFVGQQAFLEDIRGKFYQIHNKYIIVPMEEGVMIIDQHAAHERVLYEKTIARFSSAEAKTQQLLFPLTVEMTPGDAALTRQVLPALESLGFSVKFFGASTVIVDGIPVDVRHKDEPTILRDLLDTFKENEQEMKFEPRDRMAKIYSCKAAIKAGDPLNDAEIRSLLEQLFQTNLPFTCPHGRPVIVTLSLSELDRRFGRTPVT